MTTERIDRLPELLAELAAPRRPDYTDTILARTAGLRQRPARTFLERILPMAETTLPGARVSPPLRTFTIALLLMLLVAALAIGAFIASRPSRQLPAPFGPAANGVIPFTTEGDLYAGDPVTGTTRLLVGGPEGDFAPRFSPDGTRVAFLREGTGARDGLYVADADGSDPRQINTAPITTMDFAWTPAGDRLAVVHDVGGVNQLDLFDASRNGSVERIAAAAGLDSLQFRPPDGREILISGHVNGSYGLYAVNADGTNLRPVLLSTDPESDDYWGGVTYAADGGRIFYTRPYERERPNGTCCTLWVMNADGSDQHEFIPSTGEAWNGQPTASPDGTRIAFWHAGAVSTVRADGTGSVTETGPALSGTVHWLWAPDSSKILMIQNNAVTAKAYLLDPAGGPWTNVPWASDADLDWQRLAP